MKFSIGIIAVFLLISASSCDKIDDPFPADQGSSFALDGNTEYIADPELNISNSAQLQELLGNNSWDSITASSNANARFVLIEEFTGHKCVNCPRGTKEVVRLDGLFGDTLIPMGIHAGTFATPRPGTNYDSDYRVLPHCDIYSTEFGVEGFGYPSALVSRQDNQLYRDGAWEAEINDLVDQAPLAEIQLKNYYSSASNLLRIDVNVIWKQDLPENYKLQVMVKEDHIIDWQEDIFEGDIENYDHRHVLRKVVNGTFGRALEPAQADSSESLQYILPTNPEWKSEDVETVVYVFRDDASAYEVIQANSAHIE